MFKLVGNKIIVILHLKYFYILTYDPAFRP